MALNDISIASLDGTPGALGQITDKVALVVNVASKCGLTPQYEQLEELQRTYGTRGFTVLGVPCNQFMEQEPGTAEEIASFCSTTYGVSFPLTEKIEVNGENRHALYDVLTSVADADGRDGDIQWNFEKFLIGNDGEVIARYAPTVEPDDARIVADIESALA